MTYITELIFKKMIWIIPSLFLLSLVLCDMPSHCRNCACLKIEHFRKKLPLIKKTHATPVPIVLLPFSIQTPCGVVYFTKQLVCVSIEKEKNQPEQKFKKEANSCSYGFLFFSNETHTSCLVRYTTPQGVWIEKDKRTIWTGVACVFLIRGSFLRKCSIFKRAQFLNHCT